MSPENDGSISFISLTCAVCFLNAKKCTKLCHKKITVVHHGKVIITIKYYRLSHNVVTEDVNCDILTAYC